MNNDMNLGSLAEDPTFAAASDALTAWETESQTAGKPATDTPASAPPPIAPGTDSTEVPAADLPAGDGTPTTQDPAKPAESTNQTPKAGVTPPAAKPTDPKPGEPSKFAKDQARRVETWENINRRKDDQDKTQHALDQRAAALQQQEAALAQREAKLNQPRYKPEDFDAHAAKLESQADAKEADGEDSEAAYLRRSAKEYRRNAQQLRENPPKPDPTIAQQKEAERVQFAARQKEWWGKSAVDFPAVATEGSPERTALLTLIKSEPDIVNDPKGMYYASRLASAETSAARVPTLESELTALKARVKELQELTNVPSDGNSGRPPAAGGKTFEEMSAPEQMAELERQARGMSTYV